MIKICINPNCSAIWHNCQQKNTKCKNCQTILIKITDEQYHKKFKNDFHQYDYNTEDLYRPTIIIKKQLKLF